MKYLEVCFLFFVLVYQHFCSCQCFSSKYNKIIKKIIKRKNCGKKLSSTQTYTGQTITLILHYV